MERSTNIRVAGLGGMGVLTAAGVLGDALLRHGYRVKKAEVHGMSQRGGSVSSEVRFGTQVLSPMIPRGEMDYLVLLEPDQRPLYERDLHPSTVVLSVADFDVTSVANPRAVNIAMLGWLSVYLDVPRDAWQEAIRERLPQRVAAINLDAFDAGAHTGQEHRRHG
jgi:indolepyruvate ferredoxin oxidoreductase beta subunit